MRLKIVALGSRGDVQPMIALGKRLQAAGHDVTLIAGENFRTWVQARGLKFVPTLDTEALMKSPQGVAWVEAPNPLQQLGHMKRLLVQHAERMYAPIVEQARDADALISGFVSEPFVQAACEKFGVCQINTPLQPYLPTRSGAASMMAPVKNRDSLLNLLTGFFADRIMWNVAAEATNMLRTGALGLPKHSAGSYVQEMHRTPTIYGFSRYVVPPAKDWSANIQVAGYWFLDAEPTWQPPDALARFLDAGAPPVYVGFGSMPSSSPEQTVALIGAALSQAGQRGVIASGWGGVSNIQLPDHVCVVESVPHDWLFAHVAGVVHHGGAGTTAAGLRAGLPTLILPHLADQPYWARRVHALGVGVKPIPRRGVTVDNLAEGIRTLVEDTRIKAAAAQLGDKIRAERGVENAVLQIEQTIN